MKSKLVNKKIVGLILIILLLLTTKTYATSDKFNTTLKVNRVELERGDSVTITFGLTEISIKSGEEGIGAYTASVKFDSSVLEYVSTNGTAQWEAPFYQEGLITGNTRDGEVVKTNQEIGTITFKVKKDAKLGETNIELTNFSGSTVANDVATSDTSIKITILDSSNENNDNNNSNNNSSNNNNNNNNDSNNSNNSNSNNNNSNSSNNANNNNNNKNNNGNSTKIPSNDNTVVNGRLPKTGKTNILSVVFIVAIIICSTFCYIKMKN